MSSKSTTKKGFAFVDEMGFVPDSTSESSGGDEESKAGVRRYYGKYRGSVKINVDPLRMGRIMVTVPDVYGPNVSTWAVPCLPAGGMVAGMYVAPPINAGVWVEFEQGDPDFPIWVGCWWGMTAETPMQSKTTVPGVAVITLETAGGKSIVLSDTPVGALLPQGGVLISAGPQSYVAVSPTGVDVQGTLVNFNLKLPPQSATVNVNAGALIVT
jgi:hypothetical protein